MRRARCGKRAGSSFKALPWLVRDYKATHSVPNETTPNAISPVKVNDVDAKDENQVWVLLERNEIDERLASNAARKLKC